MEKSTRHDWVDAAFLVAVDNEKIDEEQLEANRQQYQDAEFKVLIIGQQLFSLPCSATFVDIAEQIYKKYGIESHPEEDFIRFTEAVLYCAAHEEKYSNNVKSLGEDIIAYAYKLVTVYNETADGTHSDDGTHLDDLMSLHNTGSLANEEKGEGEENQCKACFVKDATIQALKAEVDDLSARESSNFARTEVLQQTITAELSREMDAQIRITEKDDSIAMLKVELEESAMKILNLDLKVYDMEKEAAKNEKAVRNSKIQARELNKLHNLVKHLNEEIEIMKPKAEKYDNSHSQLDNMRTRLADYHVVKQELARISCLYQEAVTTNEAQEKEIDLLKGVQKELESCRVERDDYKMKASSSASKLAEQQEALDALTTENIALRTGEEERLLQIQMLDRELRIAQEELRQSELGRLGGHGLKDTSEEALIALEVERLRGVVADCKEELRAAEEEKLQIIASEQQAEEEVIQMQKKMAKLQEELQDKHLHLLECDQIIAQFKKAHPELEDVTKAEGDFVVHTSEEMEALRAELLEAREQLRKLNTDLDAKHIELSNMEKESRERQEKLEGLLKQLEGDERKAAARGKWNNLLDKLAKNMDGPPTKKAMNKPKGKPDKKMVELPAAFSTIGTARSRGRGDMSSSDSQVPSSGGLNKDTLSFDARKRESVPPSSSGTVSDIEIEKMREVWAYHGIKQKIELVTKILVIADDLSSEQYGALAGVTKKLEAAAASKGGNSFYLQSAEALDAKQQREQSEAKALDSITGREEAGNTANVNTKARILRENLINAANTAGAEQLKKLAAAEMAGNTAAQDAAKSAIRQHAEEEIKAYVAARTYALEELQALEAAMMYAFDTAQELANARSCADVETSVLLGESSRASADAASAAEVLVLRENCKTKLNQATDTQRRYATNLNSALEASSLRRRAVMSLLQSYQESTATSSREADTQSYAATVLRQNISEMIEEGKQTENFVSASLLDSLEINKFTEALRTVLIAVTSAAASQAAESKEGPEGEKAREAVAQLNALTVALEENKKTSEELKQKYFDFFDGRVNQEVTYRTAILDNLEQMSKQLAALRTEFSETQAAKKRLEQDALEASKEANRLREMLNSHDGSNGELKKQLQQAEEALYESFQTADDLRRARDEDAESFKSAMAKSSNENERSISVLKAKHEAELLAVRQEKGTSEEALLEIQVLTKESSSLQSKLKKAQKDLETRNLEITMLKDKIAELKGKMNDPCCDCGWSSANGRKAPDAAKIRQKMQEMDGELDAMLQPSPSSRSPPKKPTLTEQDFLIGAKKDPDQEALEAAILVSKQVEMFGKSMLDLSPDELLIVDQFVEQGFTQEEAQLMVFEDVYGKIDGQGEVHQALPSVNKNALGARRQSAIMQPLTTYTSLSPSTAATSSVPKSPTVIRRRSMLDMSGHVVAAPLASTSGDGLGGGGGGPRRLSSGGNTNNQSMYIPTNSNDSSSGGIARHGGSGTSLRTPGGSERQFTVAEEAEISVICSRGYTRRDAVSMFMRSRGMAPPLSGGGGGGGGGGTSSNNGSAVGGHGRSMYNFTPNSNVHNYVTPPQPDTAGGGVRTKHLRRDSRGSFGGGSEVGLKHAVPDRNWIGAGVKGVSTRASSQVDMLAAAALEVQQQQQQQQKKPNTEHQGLKPASGHEYDGLRTNSGSGKSPSNGRGESIGSQMAQHIHGSKNGGHVTNALMNTRSSIRPGHVRKDSSASALSNALQPDYTSPGAAPPPPSAGEKVPPALSERATRHLRSDSDSSYGSLMPRENQ